MHRRLSVAFVAACVLANLADPVPLLAQSANTVDSAPYFRISLCYELEA
jgi:hypothetical protein